MNKQILLKFVKGFLTGGLSAVVAALGVGINIHSLDDLKGVLILLGTAFLSGAVHGLIEMLSPTLPATTSTIVTTSEATPPV